MSPPTRPSKPSPTSVADDDLVVRLRLALARLARQQRKAVPSSLTPSQQSALAMIDRHGPVRLGKLATIEGVAAPTITRIVGKLVERGLVDRIGDEGDRRVARVTITAEGRAQMAETRLRRNRWLEERLAGLDERAVASILGAVPALEQLVDDTTRPVATC